MPEYRVMAVGLTYPDSFIDSTYRDEQTSAWPRYFQDQARAKCNQVLLQSVLGCVPIGKETGKAEVAFIRAIPADLCESENSGATEFLSQPLSHQCPSVVL